MFKPDNWLFLTDMEELQYDSNLFGIAMLHNSCAKMHKNWVNYAENFYAVEVNLIFTQTFFLQNLELIYNL